MGEVKLFETAWRIGSAISAVLIFLVLCQATIHADLVLIVPLIITTVNNIIVAALPHMLSGHNKVPRNE